MYGVNMSFSHLYGAWDNLLGGMCDEKDRRQMVSLALPDCCAILGKSLTLSGPVTQELYNGDTKTVLFYLWLSKAFKTGTNCAHVRKCWPCDIYL